MTNEEIAAADKFAAKINNDIFRFRDPVPSARQMLDEAKFSPADECVLIQAQAHGTRAIGLDDTVDLREQGTEVFWAFKSDRVFRFTIEGHGYEWGAAIIDEPTLRAIAHLKEDQALELERENEPDQQLGPDDVVRLADKGTEHLRIKAKLLTVFFKKVAYRLSAGTYTTEELISKFPIEPGYLLNLLEGETLVTLQSHQKVHIKEGMQFFSQPPHGASS